MSHSDRPDPESVLLNNGSLAATPEAVFAEFKTLGIDFQTWEHEALFTVAQAKEVNYELPGAHTKNLFLRNKKGRMFLLVVQPDHQVDLKALRQKLQLPGGQIAFASTERLGKYLGVVPGSVSPLALINDNELAVQLMMDRKLFDHEWIFMHPCRNTHSVRLKTQDFLELMERWKHSPQLLSFDDDEDFH